MMRCYRRLSDMTDPAEHETSGRGVMHRLPAMGKMDALEKKICLASALSMIGSGEVGQTSPVLDEMANIRIIRTPVLILAFWLNFSWRVI